MNILPVKCWQNGQEKEATIFELSVISDNLSTQAVFEYYLICVTQTSSIVLITGNITISGVDYQEWDAEPSANLWAYNWAATQLNLTIVQ
jgi:hypothetical protein